MQVLTIGNEKGGVGKTRTACEISCRLADKGLRVVLIDADSQGHVARNFGLAKKPDFYDCMVRDVPIETVMTVIPSEKWNANELRSPNGALWVLLSNIETRGIRLHVDDDLKLHDELQRLDGICDIVVIDTSPAPTNHSLIMRATTDYLMVTKMEYLSVDSMMETMGHIQRYNRSSAEDRQIKFAGILPTMFKANTVEHTTYLNALREREDFDGLVMPPISESIVVPEADRAQLPLSVYAPSHKVSKEYAFVAGLLIDEVMYG
jgi:chromosome partitioning protein